MKKIFFNSSLPRSGSTLIQNLLAQNPEIYSTPTSGLVDFVIACKNNYNHSQAFQAQDQDEMTKAFVDFCKDGMQGYFKRLTDKPIVMDKSREWGINYGLIEMLQDEPKIICMVRDIRAIYSSMEKNFRKNPHRENGIQNPAQLVGTTLNKRVDIWASGIPVGVAIDRLQDIIQQNIDNKMLFIRYEDLMDNPEEEMSRIYNYLELPYYEGHDFENISQLTHEDDRVHGIFGDHQLRPKFERKPDDYMEVLGYEISMNIKNHYKWFYDYFGYV
jgi:sulfotransferase